MQGNYLIPEERRNFLAVKILCSLQNILLEAFLISVISQI